MDSQQMNTLREQVRSFYNMYHASRRRLPEAYQLDKYWDFLSGDVLEIGAGRWLWSNRDYRYIIVELSDTALQMAVAQGVAGVLADGEQLPFPGRSFSTVACHDVLEHVVNPALFIQEMCRVARETVVIAGPNFVGRQIGGQLTLALLHAFLHPHWRTQQGIIRLPDPHLSFDDRWAPDADAITALNAWWVVKALAENGFRITHLETWGPALKVFDRLPHLRYLGHFMILQGERIT